MNADTGTLLDVAGLAVAFPSADGDVRAVDGISYRIPAGCTLGVVGESGCGKTVASLAVLRLVPAPGRIVGGRITFSGRDLSALSEDEMEALRGDRIAMIFQEPMTALNPVFSIGDQISEVLVVHRAESADDAWDEAVALLDRVGIPSPAARAHDYPHNLSGGMRQRAMIAMALACRPQLLIADEPSTALDVTVQAQILDLLLQMQDELGMAIQFITHNLGVISEVADEIMVMYAGRIVETASAEQIFAAPAHPYTRGLLETVPRLRRRVERLPAIAGSVPAPGEWPRGCRFANRCRAAIARCTEHEPQLESVALGHRVACFVTGAQH